MDIRWIFCSAFKSNQMQVEAEKSNPFTSPSLKAADALKFTQQGPPCSRQWGREGGCSVWLPLLLRSAPRACIYMCNFGISIYLANCYADLWLRELGLFPVPSWPSLCEGGSSVLSKQQAALAISNPLTGQIQATAANSAPAESNTLIVRSVLNRNTLFFCLEITNERLASPPSLHCYFLHLKEIILSKRRRHGRVCCDSRKGQQVISVSNRGHKPQPSSKPPPTLHLAHIPAHVIEELFLAGYFQPSCWDLHINKGLIQSPLEPTERFPLFSGALDQVCKESSSLMKINQCNSTNFHKLKTR